MEVHIVVKGDTLWKIARQYGIPFEDLKRVNAHLANPDYIVPGMKIFLPKRQHNAENLEKGKGQVTPYPPKGTTPSPPIPVPKPPTSKPSTPKPPTPRPPAPAPAPRPPAPTPAPRPPAVLPTMPAPVPLPTPTPTPTPTPMPMPTPTPTPTPMPMPTPTPTPTPMPMPMPMPMHPPQTFAQPMIGIPCGWMPIFDADCFPFMHSGQIQAMPKPEPPMQQAPLPMPLPSTQFPKYEQESPIISGQGPATSPIEVPMIEGWQLLESPDFMFEETDEMIMQPSAEYSPQYMHEESPEFDLQPSVPCPPGPGYVPQAISPAVQGQWNPGQFGFPAMPHPGHQQGCGCEGQQPQHHHHQQMMIPLFYGHPCNCPSCMQQGTPYSGMPPNQGSNWYGAY